MTGATPPLLFADGACGADGLLYDGAQLPIFSCSHAIHAAKANVFMMGLGRHACGAFGEGERLHDGAQLPSFFALFPTCFRVVVETGRTSSLSFPTCLSMWAVAIRTPSFIRDILPIDVLSFVDAGSNWQRRGRDSRLYDLKARPRPPPLRPRLAMRREIDEQSQPCIAAFVNCHPGDSRRLYVELPKFPCALLINPHRRAVDPSWDGCVSVRPRIHS